MLSLYHVTKGCVLELKKTQTKKKKRLRLYSIQLHSKLRHQVQHIILKWPSHYEQPEFLIMNSLFTCE